MEELSKLETCIKSQSTSSNVIFLLNFATRNKAEKVYEQIVEILESDSSSWFFKKMELGLPSTLHLTCKKLILFYLFIFVFEHINWTLKINKIWNWKKIFLIKLFFIARIFNINPFLQISTKIFILLRHNGTLISIPEQGKFSKWCYWKKRRRIEVLFLSKKKKKTSRNTKVKFHFLNSKSYNSASSSKNYNDLNEVS